MIEEMKKKMILIDTRKREVLFFLASEEELSMRVITLIDKVNECFKGFPNSNRKELKKFRIFIDDNEIMKGVVR